MRPARAPALLLARAAAARPAGAWPNPGHRASGLMAYDDLARRPAVAGWRVGDAVGAAADR